MEPLEPRQMLSAGALDPTFGNSGLARTDFGAGNDRAEGLAIQSDNKILVAGSTLINGNSDFALARYNANGSLDTTFGNGGKVTTDFGTPQDDAASVAIQADGRILVAGSSYISSRSNFALARYNTDGSLDTTFGNGGMVTTLIGSAAYGKGLAIQGDGRIVVAGYCDGSPSTGEDFALARYNSDGSLDSTFGGQGTVTTDFAGEYDMAYDVAIQSDGRIVAAGKALTGSTTAFALTRYNANGSLDPTFDDDGQVTTSIAPDYEQANDLALQSNGKIVVTGNGWGSAKTGADFTLARYNADGSLDPTFAGDGTASVDVGTLEDQAQALAIQPDGRIIMTGTTSMAPLDQVLVRCTANGSLDTTFGNAGRAPLTFGSAIGNVFNLAFQADGRIIVTGTDSNGSNYDFVVARLSNDATAKVTGVSSGSPNGAYPQGTWVLVDVSFDQPVMVSGAPQLTLAVGGTQRQAEYLSGNGTNTLTFSYRVQAGDVARDLDYASTSALLLNGGSIKVDSGWAADLRLPAPGQAGSLAANKNLILDGIAPNTTFTDRPASLTNKTSARFAFTGSDNLTASANLTYEGRLDGGAYVALTNPAVFTDLADGSHTFEVRALDAARNFDTTPASITWVIAATPNHAPTDILLPQATALEQQPPGTPVGMFATVDPDMLNSFSYTLVSGAGDTDNASFTIDAIGDLLTTAPCNFYTKSSYTIRVRSTDQDGLWFEKPFTVAVSPLTGRRIDLVSAGLLSATGNGTSSHPSISNDGRYVAFESCANNLVAGDAPQTVDIFVKDLVTGTTRLVSTNSDALPGNADSHAPSISGNGRYVAFCSYATNLVADDTNGVLDIFVKDLVTGGLTRISTNSAAEQANNSSEGPSISDDGRYVAFESNASNLVASDSNWATDVFVKDLATGTITLVDTSSAAVQGNNYSNAASISGDGRYVAFQSNANNLIAGDTNGRSDIFVKDLVTGSTTRASTDYAGLQGNAGSIAPDISDDGRYVAFRTYASNLLPPANFILETPQETFVSSVIIVVGVLSRAPNILVKDLVTGTTTFVGYDDGIVYDYSHPSPPSISGDGRYVAFESHTSNRVSQDTNMYAADIFLTDTLSGVTTLVSTSSSGVQGTFDSEFPRISSNGRYVAFASKASPLIAGDTNRAEDIFVKTLDTGATSVASTRGADVPPQCGSPGPFSPHSISRDGRYVAFASEAGNLVAGDIPGIWAPYETEDVFVKDMTSGLTTLVSTDSAGVQGADASSTPSISGDGRYVAFQSSAENLVHDDYNRMVDIFVKNLLSGATTLVSTSSEGFQSNACSSYPSISYDGRYVAFESPASNLVSGKTSGYENVFVKDLTSGSLTLVSAACTGGPGNSTSEYPSISGNGRFVAFMSNASNLVADDTNMYSDIFVRDLLSGAMRRVSTAASGDQSNGVSRLPRISDDGRYVTFVSFASNLVAGDMNAKADVFVTDLVTGITTCVSTDSAGGPSNADSTSPSINGDGRYVTFASFATNLVTNDTNGCQDIFVKDLRTGAIARLSSDSEAYQHHTNPSFPIISADGRYVVFQSNTYNLISSDWATVSDVYRVSTSVYEPQRPTVVVEQAHSQPDPTDRTLLHFTATFSEPVFGFVASDVQFAGAAGATTATITDSGDHTTYEVLVSGMSADGTVSVRIPAGAAQDASGNDSTESVGSDNTVTFEMPRPDNCGAYDPRESVFYLKFANCEGVADLTFGYGAPGWKPLAGDWDGDGRDTIGLFDPASSHFYLRNSNTSGQADIDFGYGDPAQADQYVLVMGDWNGDGADTIGLYHKASATWFLRNTNTEGNADLTFGFGQPGSNWLPLVGDWNGDGADTIGLYDPATGMFYLRNTQTTGVADIAFPYGAPGAGWMPLIGDWDGDGAESAGFYQPGAASHFYLRNPFTPGMADVHFGLGFSGLQPIVGNWLGTTGQALAAESGSQPSAVSSQTLFPDPQSLAPILAAACARWAAAGTHIAAPQVVVTDLPGAELGRAVGNTIYIDGDAAGHGWFIDSTPGVDEEFARVTPASPLQAVDPRAVDRIDLLTVVEHELGHVAGLPDLDASLDALLSGALAVGVRRGARD